MVVANSEKAPDKLILSYCVARMVGYKKIKSGRVASEFKYQREYVIPLSRIVLSNRR